MVSLRMKTGFVGRVRANTVAIVVLLAVALAAPAASAPALPHLRGMKELKAWFNANQGHPRLILLLSPT